MKVTDEQIISAVMTNTSNRKAAESLGLSERAFYNRTSTPVFKAKLNQARERLMNCTVALLQARMSEAVDTMTTIMRDEEASPQVRLNAADTILRNSLKLSERIDILERLDELEYRLEDRG